MAHASPLMPTADSGSDWEERESIYMDYSSDTNGKNEDQEEAPHDENLSDDDKPLAKISRKENHIVYPESEYLKAIPNASPLMPTADSGCDWEERESVYTTDYSSDTNEKNEAQEEAPHDENSSAADDDRPLAKISRKENHIVYPESEYLKAIPNASPLMPTADSGCDWEDRESVYTTDYSSDTNEKNEAQEEAPHDENSSAADDDRPLAKISRKENHIVYPESEYLEERRCSRRRSRFPYARKQSTAIRAHTTAAAPDGESLFKKRFGIRKKRTLILGEGYRRNENPQYFTTSKIKQDQLNANFRHFKLRVKSMLFRLQPVVTDIDEPEPILDDLFNLCYSFKRKMKIGNFDSVMAKLGLGNVLVKEEEITNNLGAVLLKYLIYQGACGNALYTELLPIFIDNLFLKGDCIVPAVALTYFMLSDCLPIKNTMGLLHLIARLAELPLEFFDALENGFKFTETVIDAIKEIK